VLHASDRHRGRGGDLIGTGAAHAEIGGPTIKFAGAGADGSPIALGMETFEEIVEARSDGRITVRRYTGDTLGGDAQMLSSLQGGTVETTTMNAGILASVA
jgi:TRAP-type C4-dicarboxylate transport system substrate-binding protein